MERYVPKTEPNTEVAENQPKKVRGRPFAPGNSGRPPGSKNRTTQLVEQLLDGEAETITRKFVEIAKAGDPGCLKIFLDRVLPRRNGRPVELSLPPVNNIHDVVAAMAAISTAVSDGRVTTEEAAQLVHVFNSYSKMLETRDFVARLEALETSVKELK